MSSGSGVTGELAGGHRLIEIGEVGSTNDEAMRLARAGETGPLWIRADRQTSGRGRSGRGWTSVPGNLYASHLVTLPVGVAVAHQLSLVAGVALVDAVRQVAGEQSRAVPDLRLKWPNDGLIGTAKFAGLLPESSSTAGGNRLTVVIGCGVNLAGHPEGLDREATSLAAHGLIQTPRHFLGALATALDAGIRRWGLGCGFADVRAAWLERAGPIGEPLSVNAGHEKVSGGFAGLDADGALLLSMEDGSRRRFTYGDVAIGSGGSIPERNSA